MLPSSDEEGEISLPGGREIGEFDGAILSFNSEIIRNPPS